MLFGLRDHIVAYIVGGICCAISVILSFVLILRHRQNWSNPRQQQLITLIIIMVPLFAVDSYIGLIDMKASESMILFLDSVKECYEAVVISSFLSLMYAMVGIEEISTKDKKKNDDDKVSIKIPKKINGRHIHQTFPFNYFMDDFELNIKTINTLQLWTNQFVYIRPIISILCLYLCITDQFSNFWYWTTTIILNLSITLAVTALIMFYHSFEHELAPHRALAKFLCIKGVVFFAFWQSIILQVLEYYEIVHADKWYTEEQVAEAIQNLLICIEMGLLFAPIHSYAFPYSPYKQIKQSKKKE